TRLGRVLHEGEDLGVVGIRATRRVDVEHDIGGRELEAVTDLEVVEALPLFGGIVVVVVGHDRRADRTEPGRRGRAEEGGGRDESHQREDVHAGYDRDDAPRRRARGRWRRAPGGRPWRWAGARRWRVARCRGCG